MAEPGIDYGMEKKFDSVQQSEANFQNKCRKTSKCLGAKLILIFEANHETQHPLSTATQYIILFETNYASFQSMEDPDDVTKTSSRCDYFQSPHLTKG